MKRLLPAALAAALAGLLTACDDDPAGSPAVLSGNPAIVDFGRRNAGAPATVRSITIQNVGGSRGPLLGASISGPGRAGYAIVTAQSTCLGRRLAASETCTMVVSLSGQASGPLSATLRVGGGDEEVQTLVSLTGTIESLLNVYYQGTGHGSVTESAHGQSCVQICTLTLDVPTVTLTALPDPQSTFAGWVGMPGCGTSATCTMTLIDLNVATVRFDPS